MGGGGGEMEKNAEYSKQGYYMYSVEHTATQVLYNMRTCKPATMYKDLIRYKLYHCYSM